jgi:hypothetical protein
VPSGDRPRARDDWAISAAHKRQPSYFDQTVDVHLIGEKPKTSENAHVSATWLQRFFLQLCLLLDSTRQ